ncbi:hypothetical protein B0H14DRAFT_481469 [Mycena olivaceomarginata]|nr:hypothetical protein B0H14DRAFT_481469 [Mycena olivaceomarginata]
MRIRLCLLRRRRKQRSAPRASTPAAATPASSPPIRAGRPAPFATIMNARRTSFSAPTGVVASCTYSAAWECCRRLGSDDARERGRGREELLRRARRRGRARREARDEVGVALGRRRRCRVALVAAVVLQRVGGKWRLGKRARMPNNQTSFGLRLDLVAEIRRAVGREH